MAEQTAMSASAVAASAEATVAGSRPAKAWQGERAGMPLGAPLSPSAASVSPALWAWFPGQDILGDGERMIQVAAVVLIVAIYILVRR
jgi:hypothetical protein